jgi:hypothetical protein
MSARFSMPTDRPASNVHRNARAELRQHDQWRANLNGEGAEAAVAQMPWLLLVLTFRWFCSTAEQGPIRALSAVLRQSMNSFCTFSCRTGGQLRGYVLFCVRSWPNFPQTEDVLLCCKHTGLTGIKLSRFWHEMSTFSIH